MKKSLAFAAVPLVFFLLGCVTLNITVYFQPEQLDKAAEKSVERMWNLECAPVTPERDATAPEGTPPESTN